MAPVITAPAASYVVSTDTGLPCRLPVSVAPPKMKTDGTLQRTIAIMMPGRFLSQPPKPIRPS